LGVYFAPVSCAYHIVHIVLPARVETAREDTTASLETFGKVGGQQIQVVMETDNWPRVSF
jgi:hypothetical protein